MSIKEEDLEVENIISSMNKSIHERSRVYVSESFEIAQAAFPQGIPVESLAFTIYSTVFMSLLHMLLYNQCFEGTAAETRQQAKCCLSKITIGLLSIMDDMSDEFFEDMKKNESSVH